MKLKNSVEQAICLLIMIAHSDEKAPLKSYNISKSLGVSDSYLKKINDYNNKLKYGDKVEESTEETNAESSEPTSSRLDELVDRVVKARGPQAASYILRIAATGYSSKEIHGIIKSASESNQPAIKRYMGVNWRWIIISI